MRLPSGENDGAWSSASRCVRRTGFPPAGQLLHPDVKVAVALTIRGIGEQSAVG